MIVGTCKLFPNRRTDLRHRDGKGHLPVFQIWPVALSILLQSISCRTYPKLPRLSSKMAPILSSVRLCGSFSWWRYLVNFPVFLSSLFSPPLSLVLIYPGIALFLPKSFPVYPHKLFLPGYCFKRRRIIFFVLVAIEPVGLTVKKPVEAVRSSNPNSSFMILHDGVYRITGGLNGSLSWVLKMSKNTGRRIKSVETHGSMIINQSDIALFICSNTFNTIVRYGIGVCSLAAIICIMGPHHILSVRNRFQAKKTHYYQLSLKK